MVPFQTQSRRDGMPDAPTGCRPDGLLQACGCRRRHRLAPIGADPDPGRIRPLQPDPRRRGGA